MKRVLEIHFLEKNNTLYAMNWLSLLKQKIKAKQLYIQLIF